MNELINSNTQLTKEYDETTQLFLKLWDETQKTFDEIYELSKKEQKNANRH